MAFSIHTTARALGKAVVPLAVAFVALAPAASTPALADGPATITGKVTAAPARYLAETVVYLKNAPASHSPSSVTIDQKGMQFIPHVSAITVGDTVNFGNHDSVAHNVFSPDNEGFNLGTFPPNETRSYTFRRNAGYSLLCSPPGPLSINHNLYKTLPYDWTKFVPITVLALVPNVITARIDLPANSVQELIAYAKANPGKVTYASQGNGSTSHLSAQMLATMAGIEMVHVPYKGEGPALIDLTAGRVDIFIGNISAALRFSPALRHRMSAEPPAGKGTTMRTCLFG